MSHILSDCEGLTVAEIDEKLDEAVARHERSESEICFLLFEMQRRRGHEKFGFATVLDYARERFGFTARKTYYLLSLARKLENLPQITQAFEEGRLRWFKAHKIASIAKPEDEVMWLESALATAVKDLDSKIRSEMALTCTPLRFCLSEDQAAVVEYAFEVCRKVSGAQLTPEQCLEYMAADFLATYAKTAEQQDDPEKEEGDADALETNPSEPVDGDHSACPENGDTPSPFHVRPSQPMTSVFERDNWSCTYPGCSARSMLHDHHIELRSRFGKRTMEERDLPANRITVCAFHHVQLHAGIIGVEGRAPFDLKWRKPTLLDAAEMRWERKARSLAQRRARESKREDGPEGELKPLQKAQRLQKVDPRWSPGVADGFSSSMAFQPAHIGVETVTPV